MGFEIKFNWALQLAQTDALQAGQIYDFAKPGNRAFPLETPIDLIGPDREAIAKVSILEFANTKAGTTGKYQVIKIYQSEENNILTNYWIENK